VAIVKLGRDHERPKYSLCSFFLRFRLPDLGELALLMPIGHKNNTLIMGPGGYRFGDYWRMGLPLEIIVIAIGAPMILWVWPL
jgi:hypothetical protein